MYSVEASFIDNWNSERAEPISFEHQHEAQRYFDEMIERGYLWRAHVVTMVGTDGDIVLQQSQGPWVRPDWLPRLGGLAGYGTFNVCTLKDLLEEQSTVVECSSW